MVTVGQCQPQAFLSYRLNHRNRGDGEPFFLIGWRNSWPLSKHEQKQAQEIRHLKNVGKGKSEPKQEKFGIRQTFLPILNFPGRSTPQTATSDRGCTPSSKLP